VTNHHDLDALLGASDRDAGCTASQEILEAYVELELAGGEPERVYPGTAIHLQACPGCGADHDGLLEAARRFGDVKPE
jgi:predicted anti-sigma-YlaC factor YlaD